MLEILTKKREFFNEDTEEFFTVEPKTLILEHSLLSISKWESKWKKSFLSVKDKTKEEILDYIRCMTINKVDPLAYSCLSEENIRDITNYINDSMTATTINNRKKKYGRKEIITSEIIYYWMIVAGIPMECEKWHLNRLLTLIDVCAIKSSTPKKMSKQAIAQQNMSLNAARRAKYNTKG